MDEQKTQPHDTAPKAVAFVPTKEDTDANKDIAALSYVWILSLVVFLARRDSAFVRFHARQGVTVFLLSLIVWPIPFIGRVAELFVLALAVMGFVTAAQGQAKELPIVGSLSRFQIPGLRHAWGQVRLPKHALGQTPPITSPLSTSPSTSPVSPTPVRSGTQTPSA